MAAAAPKPRAGKLPRWAWYAGAAVLVLGAYIVLRGRQAAAGTTLDTSGTPRAGGGSSAQEPNGGAASIPGNLPPLLVSEPDPLTAGVQTTPGGSPEAPASLVTDGGYTDPPWSYTPPTSPAAPGTFAAGTDTPLAPTVRPSGVLTTSGVLSGTATPGYGRSLEQPNQQLVYIDATGHVTSPVGTRVGGRTLE